MYKYRVTSGGNSWEYEYTPEGLESAETKCDDLEIGYENIQTIHVTFSVENDPENNVYEDRADAELRELELKTQYSVVEHEN